MDFKKTFKGFHTSIDVLCHLFESLTGAKKNSDCSAIKVEIEKTKGRKEEEVNEPSYSPFSSFRSHKKWI